MILYCLSSQASGSCFLFSQCPWMCSRSGSIQRPSSASWPLCVGSDSELGQRSENRIQDHPREGEDRRYGTVIPTGIHETTLPNSREWILRMEKSSWRKDSILDRHERRISIRVRRVMGRLERPRERRMIAYLHHHYWRTE
jgi:hypothetical protein